MSEKDLEVLITLDDPGEDTLDEDNFHNPQAENPSQPFPIARRRDERTSVIDDDDQSELAG